MTLLFLSSIAALFPGFALPVGLGWKTISVFDAIFALMVLRAARRPEALLPFDRRLAAAAVAFCAAGVLALWAAPSPAGFRTILINGYSVAVLLLAAHMRLDTQEARRVILWPLGIALLVAWTIFAVENGFGIEIGDNQSTALPHGPYRLGGLLGGNALILFLCIGAPLLRRSWLAQAGLLLSGYATLSRAMMGLGAGTLLAARGSMEGSRGRRAVVVGLASGALILGGLTYAFAVAEGSTDASGGVSLEANFEPGIYPVFHVAALRMFLDAPLLGHGPGTFLDLFRHYTSKHEQELTVKGRDPYWDPHSAILGLAAEQGLLGLAAFGWLFVEIYRRLRRATNLEHRETATLAVTGLLIGGHVVDWIALKGLWLWIGVLVSAARDQERRASVP